MTSGFLFGGDEWQLEHFIENLINAGSAALGIKKGRFVNDIPNNIKKIAEDAYFPIIEIPYHFGWSEIISTFYHLKTENRDFDETEIKKPEDTSRSQLYNNFISSMQTGKISSSSFQKIKELRPLEKPVYTGILQIESNDSSIILNSFKKLLSSTRFQRTANISSHVVNTHDKSGAIILLEYIPIDNCSLLKFQFMLYDELCTIINNKDVIAIGGFYQDVEDVVKSYEEANRARQIGKLLWDDKNCFFYPLLSAYSLLLNNDITKVDLSCMKMLEDNKNKLSFNALETIEAYIESGNYKDTAVKLFIHENTLRYRLDRIEEVLMLDLKDTMVRNALIAQIKCSKLHSLI